MKYSEEYPGFIEVETKFKIGDIVDYYRITESYNDALLCKDILCIVTKVCKLADHEDEFEASYDISEMIDGKIGDNILGGAYESELILNKKIMRELNISKILDK